MGSERSETPETGRWAARPRWASLVRAGVFLGPVLASFGAAWALTHLWPASSGLADQALHLAALVAVSTAVLLLLDRAARRLLPLVTLLDLSLLFPKAAPSRLAVARQAIKRRPIEEQLARVRKAGADPSAVATEILALVAALSRHDRPTRGHAERVRMFTDLIAEQMRIPDRDRDLLRWAAILHDIGKLRIPGSLLNKAGKPDKEEWAALQAHPTHGAEIAGALLPWLGEWGHVILEHHERWDGTGYPQGLSGREIHLGSRIVSVADAYDVMTSARAYKRPVSRAAAYRELIKCSGSQFDPAAVRAMVSVSAPALRRAQGLVSWIADIPLVATHVVPATTLARAVGAGAVATGVVTGAALPVPSPTPPAAAATVVVADDRTDSSGSDGPRDDDATPAPAERSTSTALADPAPRPAAPEPSGAGGPADGAATPAPAPAGTGSGSSGSGSSGPGSGSSGSSGSGSGGSGSGSSGSGSGSSGSGSGPVGGVVGGVTGGLTDTVDDTTDGLTDTVDGVTGGATGGLTDPVDDTVDGVTDTVDGVVGGVTGTVDGVLGGGGGLLGGKR